jgi:hypothetical protein
MPSNEVTFFLPSGEKDKHAERTFRLCGKSFQKAALKITKKG